MNNCIDCINWDEDAIDEDGKALCAIGCPRKRRDGSIQYTAGIRTTGDDGCRGFDAKRVKLPTQK